MKVSLYAALSAVVLLAASTTAVQAVTDVDILTFALNLEYLEGEFYHCAVLGSPLPASLRGGGPASSGCKTVKFDSANIKRIGTEIAYDEKRHVAFLRAALGKAAVPIPKLNIGTAFSDAGAAASPALKGFSPYASSPNDLNFLFGAFIFEDVGVTAYLGAAPLIAKKDYLSAAGAILSVEAYHAGAIRALLFLKAETLVAPKVNVGTVASLISALRAKAGGGKDQGIFGTTKSIANIVPTDSNSLAFARTTSEVLAIVTLGAKGNKGGFFPMGLNGNIK